MEQILQLFILLPFLGFILSLLVPRKKEKIISRIAIGTMGIHLLGVVIFIGWWLAGQQQILDIKHIVLYKTSSFEFFIDFYFDKITAGYAFTGSSIGLLVTIFSRFYIHREAGFKRFFATLLLFFVGYNLVIFSGNFETLFIGWEILGICSFLLIAFYRDRYLPVKNALKVISVYRLGDVCLMLAMWMCHHLFHENITFIKLNDASFVSGHLAQDAPMFVFIAIMLLIAAAVKSALLPFSSWLPRAMEGPTTSSAVFYGSLSVHLGAFLLLRTYTFWEGIPGMKISIITLGLLSSLVATSIARVQSTVKTQIAYSSIAQIGLILVEIALGYHILALIHFTGNAFLRTYQLLVSPSVLSYLIHNMFFYFNMDEQKGKSILPTGIKNALYVLSIKEWNIDWFLFRYLWMPFKWTGKNMNFLIKRFSIVLLSVIFLLGIFGFMQEEHIRERLDHPLTIIFSILGLLMILKAFAERGDARWAWLFIVAGQCFITLSIVLNEYMPPHQVAMYMGGSLVAAIAGYVCLQKIQGIDKDISLNRFHGYSYEKPMTTLVFLVCCLGLAGLPFTPAFIGIDLLFTHIHQDQPVLIATTSLSFIFIELSILRIFARVFMGEHKKLHHPIAYRSS